VFTLLFWFEAECRRYWKMHEIRWALRKLKIKTWFDSRKPGWIDATVASAPLYCTTPTLLGH